MDVSPKDLSQNLQHHRDEIIKSINPSELYPCLVKDELLSLQDIQTIREPQSSRRKEAEAILCLVEKKGERSHKPYARLLRSLKSARQHLGHAYVISLLEGTDFAPRTELNASASIKSRLSSKLPCVIDGINIGALVPFLRREQLLTDEETEILESQTKTTRDKALTLFTTIIETKGPTAHYKFASCLKEEKEHLTHQELLQDLLQPSSGSDEGDSDDDQDDDKDSAKAGHKRKADHEIAPAAVKVTKGNPEIIRAKGILISHTYNSKVKEIRRLHYSAKWDEAEKLVSDLECRLPEDIEMYVAVSLRNCSGYVTRKKIDCVESRVQKARMLCKQIKSDNRVILESRCEWMLAKLHRYLGRMQTAQEHIDKALEMQSRIGPGEDTALGHYCQACILIRALSEEWSDEKAERAKEHLRIASDHAVLGDFGLYISHHKIRLAQLCLRSSQYHPGTCTDEALEEASQALTLNVLKLEPRTRCMYYYTKSDLFRNADKLNEAKGFATMACDLAKEYNFTSELQAITIRFKVLNYCKQYNQSTV